MNFANAAVAESRNWPETDRKNGRKEEKNGMRPSQKAEIGLKQTARTDAKNEEAECGRHKRILIDIILLKKRPQLKKTVVAAVIS